MTADQKAIKKSDTDVHNAMTSRCCGVDYMMHLTKSGMVYYSIDDVALSKPKNHCPDCGLVPSITIDQDRNNSDHNEGRQITDSKTIRKELKQWQSFKNTNPVKDLNKLFNFMVSTVYFLMFLFCCYQLYDFIMGALS